MTIVTQINARSFVNGIQLFMTAAMEITIRSRYMTVLFTSGENGAARLSAAIITAAASPNGSAFVSAVFKNFDPAFPYKKERPDKA